MGMVDKTHAGWAMADLEVLVCTVCGRFHPRKLRTEPGPEHSCSGVWRVVSEPQARGLVLKMLSQRLMAGP